MAKGRKKAQKGGQNNLLIFFAIIIVLAIVSTIVAYYYQDENKDEQTEISQQDTNENTVLEGTWVSNYDGKMLTVSGLNITIESPSVDGTGKIEGNISFENNIVTFVNTSGSCKDMEGHYLYSIDDAGELYFKLIKDGCESRIEQMTMTWFKI